MGRWEYKFVPFPAAQAAAGAAGQQAVAQATTQFAAMVRTHAQDGWEYYRLDSFPLIQPPGCLGALLGAGSTVVPFSVAVFRKGVG